MWSQCSTSVNVLRLLVLCGWPSRLPNSLGTRCTRHTAPPPSLRLWRRVNAPHGPPVRTRPPSVHPLPCALCTPSLPTGATAGRKAVRGPGHGCWLSGQPDTSRWFSFHHNTHLASTGSRGRNSVHSSASFLQSLGTQASASRNLPLDRSRQGLHILEL